MQSFTTWSLKEKVGQLFMITVEGDALDDGLKRAIVDYNIGGVILFHKNMRTLEQVYRLIQDMQQVARQHGRPPLWVSIDQEGGNISYLWQEMAISPGNMVIGASRNKDYPYQAGYIMGQQLKAIGFNMVYAPVLDINNNPLNPVIGVRAFAGSKELVTDLGLQMISGFSQAGILPVAKHFPGHGDTNIDSHVDLPLVDKCINELKSLELFPFMEAIEHGLEALMTAHILYPQIDPHRPATLSPIILKQLLRQTCGFDGFIITDSMEMAAIASHFGRIEGAIQAVNAGADIVLACGRDYTAQFKMMEAVSQAVTQADIELAAIDHTLSRILAAKERWISIDGQASDLNTAKQLCHHPPYRQTMIEMAKQGITLVELGQQVLPLDPASSVWVIGPQSFNDQSYQGERKNPFPVIFGESRYQHILSNGPYPTTAETEMIASTAGHDDTVMLVIDERRMLHPAWIRLCELLSEKNITIIAVATWNPAILDFLPDPVSCKIATYSHTRETIMALKELVEGQASFNGTYPLPPTKGVKGE